MTYSHPSSQPNPVAWLSDQLRGLGSLVSIVVSLAAAVLLASIDNRYHERKMITELRSPRRPGFFLPIQALPPSRRRSGNCRLN